MPSVTKPVLSNITLLGVIIAGLILILPTSCRLGRRHPGMAEDVSNVRQIGLTLASFAMDNDGEFPTAATAGFYELPPPTSSNDYFRQLFASDNTRSERIFWVRDSKTSTSAKPDDVTTTSGKFDPAQTLRPGDNHWAYFTGLRNDEVPARPLVVESYLPGTTTFDQKRLDGKAIVLRIDSSAKPERLSPAGIIRDGDGKNLLTTDSIVWKGATPDLRQPDPAP